MPDRPYGYGGGEETERLLDEPSRAMVKAAVSSRGLRTLIAGNIIDSGTRDRAIRDLLRAAGRAAHQPNGSPKR